MSLHNPFPSRGEPSWIEQVVFGVIPFVIFGSGVLFLIYSLLEALYNIMKPILILLFGM